jgi:hypothetical protein
LTGIILYDLAVRTPPDPPEICSSFTSLELMQVRHSQLEGKDVADMPYGDETWMTEFMGLAAERGGMEGVWGLRCFYTHIGT